MGNAETKPRSNNNLKDDTIQTQIPSHITKPTSNLVLAYNEGQFHPCIILDRARNISNGYEVFFLHNQTETEIFSGNVIGNFKALLECEVSFTIDGQSYTGKVFDMANNDQNETRNFFICCDNQYFWVSFPFIYLTPEQARQLR
ncbi:uncharacterized protein LOC115879333 [Sitophilus oryzae]|uniref:Uncharacterized protein LOC115879333 n=1 Tax=Sitophilus oryzae TaxID=7048 RepID=A0A6J2XLL5_SITOR|nr:uncharacterized protein LOC115879333 [Sitophilus oryzae]